MTELHDRQAQITFSYLLSVRDGNNAADLSRIDGYIPILAPVLARHVKEVYVPNKISEEIFETYGTHIHPYALEKISERLVERGWLVKNAEEPSTNAILYKVAESVIAAAPVPHQEVTALFDDFISYAHSETERLGTDRFSDSDLEKAFILRLQELPSPNARLLTERRESSLPEKTLTLKKNKDEADRRIVASKEQRINSIFMAYVQIIRNENADKFELLTRLSSSALLAQVVLSYKNPSNAQALNSVRFYFDGPLLMDLLDMDSPERHIAAADLLRSLGKTRAILVAFNHSVEEVRDNIRAAIQAYDERRPHRNIGARMVASQSFRDRVKLILANLENEVKALGMSLVEAPADQRSLGYFSKAEQEYLESHIGYYGHDLARQRDALSIASVVRYRAGVSGNRQELSSVRHLFVTRNPRLAGYAEKHLVENDVHPKDAMPPSITDRTLAAVLWLMFGDQEQGPEQFSARLLLANCTAIPASAEAVRNKLAEIASATDPELAKTFEVWSRMPAGAEALMRSTLGDPILITVDNTQEIIDSVMATATEQGAREERERSAVLLSDKDQTINTLKATVAQNETKLMDFEAVLASQKADIDQLKKESERKNNDQENKDRRALAIQREADERLVLRTINDSFRIKTVSWVKLGSCFGIIVMMCQCIAFYSDKLLGLHGLYFQIANIVTFLAIAGVAIVCTGELPSRIFGGWIEKKQRLFIEEKLRYYGRDQILYNIDIHLDQKKMEWRKS
nr:hypothetical protein HUO10_005234 [Paraburkholderia busanensis]